MEAQLLIGDAGANLDVLAGECEHEQADQGKIVDWVFREGFVQSIRLQIADHFQPILGDRRPGLGRRSDFFNLRRLARLPFRLAACGGFVGRHGIGHGCDLAGAVINVVTDDIGFPGVAVVTHSLRRQLGLAIGADG